MEKQNKILIIHQEKKYLNQLVAFLRDVGYFTIIASNLQQVSDLTESMEPDLIVFGHPLTAQSKKIIRQINEKSRNNLLSVIMLANNIELVDRVKFEQ